MHGFLTTATVAAGVSTGWDDRGFPTTVYPPSCQTSNPPMAAGEVLAPSSMLRAGAQTTVAPSFTTTSNGGVILPPPSSTLLQPSAASMSSDSGKSASSRLLVGWKVAVGLAAIVLGLAVLL